MPLTTHHSDELQSKGYCAIKGYFSADDAKALKSEYNEMIEKHYSRQELLRHSVYPSDKSEARESHAMMISKGKSDLPKVDHTGNPMLERLLNEHHQIVAEVTKTAVADSARALINFQSYRTGSKPVGEHFDGEYLKADRAEDGIEFQLLEGILPRYVSVMAVENENNGRGVELIEPGTGKVIQPNLGPGDMVIFDNINLRHRVPQMAKPRISIGIRNFDHLPLHFAREESYFRPGATYRKIPEGYVSEDANCLTRFHEFLELEWPELRERYGSYV